MVSQNGYHAHPSDGKRPNHTFSPYMTTNNRYTDSRVYVPNNDPRGFISDPLERGEGATRKRIAVACGRCRQRKIRCSGDKGQNLPCTNCQNAGVTPCLFLRVSSREATIKTEFEYNSSIARALAHRAPVPLPPPLLTSSNNYGAAASDFGPGSSGGGGAHGGSFRSTSSLYPYNYKSLYNSLPSSPWTPNYGTDCSAPGDYSTPQPCSPYAVVNDQPSPLMPPFTWDGRAPAGPPPPPLTLKVQAPSSASTLEATGMSSLPPPPPPPQSHMLDQHQVESHSQIQIADSQSHCHCHVCFEKQARARAHAEAEAEAEAEAHAEAQAEDEAQHNHMSSISVCAPKPHAGHGNVPSQGTDTNQYIHGELVYRPALNSPDSSVSASTDYRHQLQSSLHSALARTSIDNIGRFGACNDINNNGCGSNGNGSGSGSGCDNAVQTMQAATMDRAPSHGSVADQGAPTSMACFKQEVVDGRSAAPSPVPKMTSMQAPLPPLHSSSRKHAGSPSTSPYASGHASAANSTECLARVGYSATASSSDQPSSGAGHHCYGPKSSYHEPSLYIGTSAVGAAPVSDRANAGSIFSDQERDVVGSQGPGPVACLDSYTYDSSSSAKMLASSLSSSSLHGVYGRQNKKKSSTDSLIKTRPYSPAESPMLSLSDSRSRVSTSHMGSGCQPGTPVCGSPPPAAHPSHVQELHDIKADPSRQSHGRR